MSADPFSGTFNLVDNMAAPATALSYSLGSEQGPAAPWGRYHLHVDLASGRALIERRRLGRLDTWEVEVSDGWISRVQDTLSRTPFPDGGPGVLHADESPRQLTVGAQSCQVTLRPDADPAWAGLFRLLDAPMWLVCPEFMAGSWPDGLDEDWVRPVHGQGVAV